MDTILVMVQRVTVFMLTAALLTNLFQGTEYRKYIRFAVGLIVIVLVMSGVLAVFQKENVMSGFLSQFTMKQAEREKMEEIRILGEEYEERLRKEVKP